VYHRVLLLLAPQVHVQQLQQPLCRHLVLPHVLPHLSSMALQDCQSSVVHVLINELVVVDCSGALVVVVVHHAGPLGHVRDQAPVLQCNIPEPDQGLLSHCSSVGCHLLSRSEPLELHPLLRPHPLHVLSLNARQVLHVGPHRILLLSLVREHLMHHAHVGS